MKNTKEAGTPPIQKQTFTCFNGDQLSDVVKGASFELQQLDKGAFRADLFSASLGNGILDKGYYNLSVLTKGTFSQEYMTCGFVHEANKEGHLNGEVMHKHDILLCDEGGPLDYCLAPDSLWSTFQFKRNDLLKTGILLPKNSSTIYHLDKEMKKAFSLKLAEIFKVLEGTNETLSPSVNPDMLYNHILEIYAHAFNHATSITHPKRTESALLAKKIYQYIHDNADEPLQMIHLTELVGKSERTVERIFKRYFNLSPYTYLKIHRLNRIRNCLMQADNPSTANITHIAMANGFMQMGYFCSEYKKTFGETASETLRLAIKTI